MAEPKLKYLYVLILSDATFKMIPEQDLQIYAPNVEGGDASILRFLGFTDETKRVSGRLGRVEEMSAEKDEEGEDEDGVTYDLSWTELR